MEGIVLGVEPEKMQDTHDAQYPEYNEAVEEEERKYSQQIDDAVKGQQKAQYSARSAFSREEKIGCEYPQSVFRTEYYHSHGLDDTEQFVQPCKLTESVHEHSRDVEYYYRGDKDIERAARKIVPVSDLYYVKNTFPAHFIVPVPFQAAVIRLCDPCPVRE